MRSPKSHPAFRIRGTMSQKEYDAMLAQQAKEAAIRDETLPQEVKDRCDKWLAELGLK